MSAARTGLLFAAMLAACSGASGCRPAPDDPAVVPAAAPAAVPPDGSRGMSAPGLLLSTNGGVVRGRVHVEGPPPPVVHRAVPLDQALCGATEVVDRLLRVDAGTGGVRDAAITLEPVAEGARDPAWELPPPVAALDLARCEIFPFLSFVAPEGVIGVTNADPGLHAVRVLAGAGASAKAVPLPSGGRHEIPAGTAHGALDLVCELHYWTRARVIVTDAPYRTITGEDGAFTFAGVPAGSWRLVVRHPRFGTETRVVEVEPGLERVESIPLPLVSPGELVPPGTDARPPGGGGTAP